MRISSSYFSRQTANEMLRQQSEIAKTQAQISSGKRINKPSDDPASAARAQELHQASSQFDQFDRNSTFAESRLSLEETALGSVSNVLLRMKELALSANTDTIAAHDSDAFLAEVEQQLSELIDYANTLDSNGDYLFAGNNGDTQPFSGNNPVSYAGDDGAQTVQIGPGRTVTTSHSGVDVFQRIRNGNGNFNVSAGAGNTGTAIMSQGSVTDNTLFQKHDYSIQFTSPTTYDVIDNTTATTLVTGATYTADAQIQFAGLQVSISGTPATGDNFQVKPSANQDLFQTVNNFIDILKNPPANDAEKAQRRQKMNAFMSDLDQTFEHVNANRSEVGTRLSYIDSSREENSAIKFQVDKTIAELEDLDYAEAISRLQFQMTTLEAIQRTFSRLESMSLFNYLR